jgi:hypothetical protein
MAILSIEDIYVHHLEQQQHHQLLQLHDQYSFYTTNSQPPSSHDASSETAYKPSGVMVAAVADG